MRIGELARHSGLTVHTLRYYERIGLLPYADRDRSGLRDYDASILAWIAFLGRLRTTGMPIRAMRRYAALRTGGADTAAERRLMLEAHRDGVRARIAALQAAALVLDAKIAGYAGDEARMIHDAPDPTGRPAPPERPLRARAARPR